jgi:hypothetical protein
MSVSSESDSSHRSGGESDREGLAASSNESEVQDTPDTPKRRRNKQIKGATWILRGEITTTLLHNDSASMEDCDNDEGAKVQNTRSQTEAALGATFQILFGAMHAHVKYFIFFCNLVDILHAGHAAAATIIKIQIRGFLQLGPSTPASALAKLFKPVSAFLSGTWERCLGGLYGNKEYDDCRAENSPWLPIQTRGALGLSNKGRAANKSPQTAVIACSDVLRFVFHLN